MSIATMTFELNHKSIRVFRGFDVLSSGEERNYFGGFIHRWSDWIKFSPLMPNIYLKNICFDGSYQAESGHQYPVFTYFMRHHVFSGFRPDNGSWSDRMELTDCVSKNDYVTWNYDSSNNLITDITTGYFQYLSPTLFGQQADYFQTIVEHNIGSGNVTNIAWINEADFSDEHLIEVFRKRNSPQVFPATNVFPGTEVYKNDLPDYNPLGIKSCETVFNKTYTYMPQSPDKMICVEQPSGSKDLYIMGCFGGTTSSDLKTTTDGPIRLYTETEVNEELNKVYRCSGIFSYFNNEKDITDNVTIPNPPVDEYYIANFNIGDKIQFLSDYGVTEILIGADFK